MNCKNCGASAAGEYCFNCGQKIKIHADPSLHDVLHDGIHEFLHIDGKIFQTIWILFRYPGRLTKEYLAGHRVRYIHPIRLYLTLTLSLIYFLMPNFSFDQEKVKERPAQKVESSNVKKDKFEDSDKDLVFETGTFLDKKVEEWKWKPIFKRGIRSLEKDSKDFKKVFSSATAKSLFLLMPLFAFLLKLTYWRRKKRYPQFLYFTVHYHAALFAGLILTELIGYIYDEIFFYWVLWTWLYFVLSLKTIWNDSTKRAIQRGFFMFFVYGTVFLITLAFSALFSIYKLGLES